MRLLPAYLPQEGSWPFAGIDSDSPATMADTRSSPRAVNVDFFRGYLSKRAGYRSLAEPIEYDGVVTSDPILALVEFRTASNSTFTVACTTKRQFKLNGDSWDDITPVDGGGDAIEWTGDEGDGIQWVIGTDVTGRYLYITNGVDLPRRWDGDTATFQAVTISGLGSFVTAKTLAVYADSLILGNIQTAGNDPQVVSWSDTAQFSTFSGGNSGSALLADSRGALLRQEVLGDRLVLYSEDSIGCATYQGTGLIYAFETLAQDTRLLSGRGVCNVGLCHFFMGREGIYAFDGTRNVRPITNPIRDLYRNALALNLASRSFAFHDSNENRCYFVVPDSETSSTVFIFEYLKGNPLQGSWTIHRYADRPSAIGYYTRSNSETWDDPDDGTWDEWAGTWNDLSERAGFPSLALAAQGEVFLFQGTYFGDDEEPVAASWESIDFTVPTEWPGGLGRWFQMDFEAFGSAVSVSYSADRGASWSDLQEFALTSSPSPHRFHLDAVSAALRFRFSATGNQAFTINRFRAGVRYAGVG